MSSAGINPSSSASVFLSRNALLSQGESAGVFQGRSVRGCQDKSAKQLNLLMGNKISDASVRKKMAIHYGVSI